MGLSGTFAVQAYGANDQYQWSRNGVSISGATSSSYTTPLAAFSDTGEIFTVTITNVSGSITTNPATLTVTARAPIPGDLRFQQVDAASTINGYAIQPSAPLGCPVPGQGATFQFGPGTGTAFFLTNATCLDQMSSFFLPTGVSGLNTTYSDFPIQDYQSILTGSPSYLSFPGPSDPGSVITSLYFQNAANAGALAYIHSNTSSGFVSTPFSVPASGLQAFATQEGLRGHVLTAIAYDGTTATGFSYGWSGDPSNVYEVQVVFTTLNNTTPSAQSLAAAGYIITATGSTQAEDGSGVIVVGTRVQGDTMPRPFLVGDVLAGTVDPLLAQGYAIVGVVSGIQNNAVVLKNYLGER
jgi:hypothetical protein